MAHYTGGTIEIVYPHHNPNEGRDIWNRNFQYVEDAIHFSITGSTSAHTQVQGSTNITVLSSGATVPPIYTAYLNDDVTLSSIFSSSLSADTFYIGTGSTTPTFMYDLYADLPFPGDEDYIYGARDTNNLYRWDSGTTQYIAFNDVNINNPSANSESQTFYVRLATNGALNSCTYNNSLSGIGATLTATANGVLGQASSPGLIDTKVAAVSDLILIKNQASALQNGIYEVTQTGDGSNPFILTRIDGYNQTDEVYPSIVFVSDGSANINRYFSQSTANPVIGTNSLVYQVATVSQAASPVVFVDSVTTTALPTSTYANGTVYPVTIPGYGATLSATTTGALGTINGVTMTSGMRLLVKDQANQAHNGVYTVTNPGSATQKWVLTRFISDSSMFYKTREYVVSHPNSLAYGDRYSVSSPLSMANSAYGTTAIIYAKNNESNLYDLWSASTGSNSIIANNGTGNLANGDYSFAIGDGNSITGTSSSILGGVSNRITFGYYSSIAGGLNNSLYGSLYSTIAGGLYNFTDANITFIGAGYANSATTRGSVVVGGYKNKTIAYGSYRFSAIVGGVRNETRGSTTFIGAGMDNKIDGNYSFIGGGIGNSATTNHSSIVGGQNNLLSGSYSFIGGGRMHVASGVISFIGGGQNNLASGPVSFIGGGYNNVASGSRSIVVGGKANSATTTYASVVGGWGNLSYGFSSFVGNGYHNSAITSYAAIVGGSGNLASGQRSFVGSGQLNSATTSNSSVVGGKNNLASGYYSFIGGGQQNLATHSNSHIIGSNITSVSANTTHVENLNIYTTPLNNNALTQILARDTDGTIKYRDAATIMSGATSGLTIAQVLTNGSVTNSGQTISGFYGSQIDFEYNNKSGIGLTTDGGGYLESFLFIDKGSVEAITPTGGFTAYSSDSYNPNTGLTWMWARKEDILDLTNFSIILSTERNKELISLPNTPGLYVFNNTELNQTNTSFLGDGAATFLSTENSTINSGVTGSVIIGGQNISAITSNTVYVPNLSVQSGGTINSTNGGGQLNLNNSGDGNVLLTTDSGAGGETGLDMNPTTITMFSNGYDKGFYLGADETEWWNQDANTDNQEMKITLGSQKILWGHNNTNFDRTHIQNVDYAALALNASNPTFLSGVSNSVIVGGVGITATTDNTVYVPRLVATRTDEAALNLPVLDISFTSTTQGDVWITTGATSTFINVYVGGVVKSVELS